MFRLRAEKWKRAEWVLRSARRDPVDDPKLALKVLTETHPELRHMSKAILDAYEAEPEATRFGIVQALTRAAQGVSPEQRLAVEEIAGQIAARASALEESS